MATFQYFSDIHLEIYEENERELEDLFAKIKPCAPFLILAGDIGYPSRKLYKSFLEYLSPLFQHIFIISGNHEYYDSANTRKTMMDIDTNIRKVVAEFPNITFLQNEVYDMSDICSDLMIFGGTFWSDIKPEEKEIVSCMMMDYRKIKEFNVSTCCSLHNEAIRKLKEALDTYPEKRFIIISHHLPSYSLIHPRFINSGLNSAFASDIDIAKDSRIVVWIAGHTHETICEFN